MKKVVLFFVFLSCAVISNGQSDISFGIKGGFNYSTLTSAFGTKSKLIPGFHFGFYLKKPLNDKVLFRPEIFYSRQGSKADNYFGDIRNIHLHYIIAPILFETRDKIFVQVGPQIGYLLRATEKGMNFGDKIDRSLKDITEPFDISMVLGVGFNASKNFNFGLRGTVGLTNILKRVEKANYTRYPEVKSRVLQFYIAYTFKKEVREDK
jgi:hypothetical protein